jgi:hypothetical protein
VVVAAIAADITDFDRATPKKTGGNCHPFAVRDSESRSAMIRA